MIMPEYNTIPVTVIYQGFETTFNLNYQEENEEDD